MAGLFLITACDQADDNQPNFQTELFNPLSEAFDAVTPSNIDPVMAFFDENYLYCGITKSARRVWLEGIWNTEPNPIVTVTLNTIEHPPLGNYLANWRLLISSPNRGSILADSLFIGDNLVKSNDRWMLFGNQVGGYVPVNFQTELFTPLDSAFDAAVPGDMSPVMLFFAEDYLHFGVNKNDRQNWLEGIWAVETNPVVSISLNANQQYSDSTGVANWRLFITTPDRRSVLADSLFTGDKLVKRNGNWQLRGNQITCSVPTPKQRVIIEYFTFLGCPNCPVVEAKLHELQQAYPTQLSYVEHHTSGPLVVPGDDTYAYYGSFPVPTSIFQGQTLLTGSGIEILDCYLPLTQSLASIDSDLRYSNLIWTLKGQTLTGSVLLQPLTGSFSQENLALNVVLIERESTYQNTQGDNLKNTVRAKAVLDLSTADLGSPVAFTLNSAVAVPDDASLVIFAQTKPPDFANDAVIHSGIEAVLTSAK
jgi:hypothetical protein